MDSEPNYGTLFRIYLPAAKTAADLPQPRPKPEEAALRGGKEIFLVADDHDGIREMVRTALQGCGYRVLLAMNGEEAIHIFEERSREISLVVLDMVMPHVGGLEAAARMRQLRAELPVIFTTGYSAENEALTKVIRNRRHRSGKTITIPKNSRGAFVNCWTPRWFLREFQRKPRQINLLHSPRFFTESSTAENSGAIFFLLIALVRVQQLVGALQKHFG